ncbi:MAG: glycine cleavage T C-terminal barrel domain-containing protein, partial [Pseudomonadota bacterium]
DHGRDRTHPRRHIVGGFARGLGAPLGNQLVGETTSGGMGYRSGKVIALGVVDTAASTPGTDLNIEIFGKKHKAIVQPDQPIWDPENERLRA